MSIPIYYYSKLILSTFYAQRLIQIGIIIFFLQERKLRLGEIQ